jgi:hypothetical protein
MPCLSLKKKKAKETALQRPIADQALDDVKHRNISSKISGGAP